MCLYRSYFEKNNTIISNSEINTAKNQVADIFYGRNPNIHSRFLFKIDLSKLINKINLEEITEDKIGYHKLKIYNTINDLNNFIGKDIGYSIDRKRASSVELILFEIPEEWDEGSGYDFEYSLLGLSNPKNKQPSNWFNNQNNEEWTINGIYDNNNLPTIIDTISIDNGDENIDVDISEYINGIIYDSNPNNGLGLAYRIDIESTQDEYLYSLSYHTKYTTTYFEPHLETKINTVIKDDRNCFKLDENNRLYLYAKRGQELLNITPISVNLYNHKYELIDSISNTNIIKQSKGIYYINLNLDSDSNIDSVIYYDEWNYEINGVQKSIENEFYLIENNSNFLIESMQPKNIINVTLSGILQDQKIKRGEELILDLIIKKLYNQNNSEPYNFEYRVFIEKSNNKELEIIPFTPVNRAPNKYFIKLNTEILIPYKYKLELKLNNIDYTLNYETVNFIVKD